MGTSSDVSGGMFMEQAAQDHDGKLRNYQAWECFSSLVFGNLACPANQASREVVLQVGVLGWNIGCCRDPMVQAKKVLAAQELLAASLGTDCRLLIEMLNDFVTRKSRLFPWITAELSVSGVHVDDDALAMVVSCNDRTHVVNLVSKAPVVSMPSFCRAIEEIAACTEGQLPILSRILDVPLGLSDIDKTKITAIYSCQIGNLAGYAQFVEQWSRMLLSDSQRDALATTRQHIAAAQTNTRHLLAILLTQYDELVS